MHHRPYQHIASIQFSWVFAMDEVNKFKHLSPRSVPDGDGRMLAAGIWSDCPVINSLGRFPQYLPLPVKCTLNLPVQDDRQDTSD